MSNTTVQSRISPVLKDQAEAVLNAIGLSTADAIRLFLQQVVNTGGLPFQPTTKRSNRDTEEAIQEIVGGGGQVFNTTGELFADWGA